MQKPLSPFCLFIHFSWDIFLNSAAGLTASKKRRKKANIFARVHQKHSTRTLKLDAWLSLYFVNIFIGFLLQFHVASSPPPQLKSTSRCSVPWSVVAVGHESSCFPPCRAHPFESVLAGCTEVSHLSVHLASWRVPISSSFEFHFYLFFKNLYYISSVILPNSVFYLHTNRSWSDRNPLNWVINGVVSNHGRGADVHLRG